jgi:hypothetical protein
LRFWFWFWFLDFQFQFRFQFDLDFNVIPCTYFANLVSPVHVLGFWVFFFDAVRTDKDTPAWSFNIHHSDLRHRHRHRDPPLFSSSALSLDLFLSSGHVSSFVMVHRIFPRSIPGPSYLDFLIIASTWRLIYPSAGSTPDFVSRPLLFGPIIRTAHLSRFRMVHPPFYFPATRCTGTWLNRLGVNISFLSSRHSQYPTLKISQRMLRSASHILGYAIIRQAWPILSQ